MLRSSHMQPKYIDKFRPHRRFVRRGHFDRSPHCGWNSVPLRCLKNWSLSNSIVIVDLVLLLIALNKFDSRKLSFSWEQIDEDFRFLWSNAGMTPCASGVGN